MKQMMKRCTALTAAALMAVSPLAGCGGADSATDSQANETSQTSAEKISVVDTWYLGGKTTASYLVFKEDGTVESYEPGGKLLAKGTYTYEGTSLKVTMVSADGEKKEKKPDTFDVSDKNTLLFTKNGNEYVRASAAKAQMQADTAEESKLREKESSSVAAAEGKQALSDATLAMDDVTGTWFFKGDKNLGTIGLSEDGVMTTTDAKKTTTFTGNFKLNGSKVDVYSEKGDYLWSLRMQQNGQLTDDGGKTGYTRLIKK